jgi:hypothetical protein
MNVEAIVIRRLVFRQENDKSNGMQRLTELEAELRV